MTAVQKYAQVKRAAGEALPEWISAKDLVRGGFLSEGIVDEYAPAELIFATHSDPAQPQDVLAVAKWANGQDLCLMGDGSIQQVSSIAKSRRGLKYP